MRFEQDAIAEIDSERHILAQCLDVVLGSNRFRLSDRHLDKPPGARVRGTRTRAKKSVYQHIHRCIRTIHPRFNIGVSTGRPNGRRDRGDHPYRHRLIAPRDSTRDGMVSNEEKTP
ncbi:MAG: hypothetical protein DYG94_12565 [Leptolyngbya sp. PLA3]|nr:MAG: hypothetical protein EDM82_12890 [Cyanobacteria bacterium CYA]MCE7969559.1 hypothetical protein [Leptolyngbya sp. PL-A3]